MNDISQEAVDEEWICVVQIIPILHWHIISLHHNLLSNNGIRHLVFYMYRLKGLHGLPTTKTNKLT